MAVPVEIVVVALLLAGAGSRLLGTRLPLQRALLTGTLGGAVGVATAYAVHQRHPDSPGEFIGAGASAALAATMVVIVIAGLVTPSAPRDFPSGLPHPMRAVRRAAQNARRYAQLTRIVARYRLTEIGKARADTGLLGHRLRLAMEDAGPIFVKLGQVLSTRSDLLPEAVTTELASLQDRVPPEPWPAVERELEAELGRDPHTVLAEVEHAPLASASLAQVYAAMLADGSPVVLKVQRPGISEPVMRDLEMVRRLTRRMEARAEWARSYHLADLGRGFADGLTEELDFRVEARNIAAIAAAAPAGAPVKIPAVHTDLSSRRLLVLERLDGVSVRDAGREMDRLGTDRTALARQFLGYMLRQILVEGTFHADPHPGNVLFLRSGELGLVDFGAVGRIDLRQQAALRRLLLALALRDANEFYEAVSELAVRGVRDEEALEDTLAAFMAQHLGPGMASDPALVRSVTAMLASTGIGFPPSIGAVFRALVTLDGTIRTIAPGFDLAIESEAVAQQFMGEQLTPASLRDAAEHELLTLLPMLRKLPRRADRISAALAEGRLTTNIRLFSDPNERAFVAGIVNRAVLAFVGSSLGMMSVVLLLAPVPWVGKGANVLHGFGYIGLFLSVTLVLRVVLEILGPRRR